MKHKRSTESLEAVHTHTHTHTPCFTKNGLIYRAKNTVEQYIYSIRELKKISFFKDKIRKINKNNMNKKLGYIVEVNNCKKMIETIKRIKLLQDSLAFL